VTVAGTGGVARDAAAVALNLAVTDPRRVASSPRTRAASRCRSPRTSTSSPTRPCRRGDRPVGANGQVCIYNSAATHLIVDVMGSFPAAERSARGPDRLADTREPAPRRGRLGAARAAPCDGARRRRRGPQHHRDRRLTGRVRHRLPLRRSRAATSNVNFAAGSDHPEPRRRRARSRPVAVCLRPEPERAPRRRSLRCAVRQRVSRFRRDPRARHARVVGAMPRSRAAASRPSPVRRAATGVLVNVTAVDASRRAS
jgi:hypothetical protein